MSTKCDNDMGVTMYLRCKYVGVGTRMYLNEYFYDILSVCVYSLSCICYML